MGPCPSRDRAQDAKKEDASVPLPAWAWKSCSFTSSNPIAGSSHRSLLLEEAAPCTCREGQNYLGPSLGLAIRPLLQMEKLNQRGYLPKETASKGESWNSDPGSGVHALNHCALMPLSFYHTSIYLFIFSQFDNINLSLIAYICSHLHVSIFCSGLAIFSFFVSLVRLMCWCAVCSTFS